MVNYGDVNDVNDINTSLDSTNGDREPDENDINPTQDEILSHFQEVTGNSSCMWNKIQQNKIDHIGPWCFMSYILYKLILNFDKKFHPQYPWEICYTQ
jgi:hypothetical protein